VDVNYRLVRHFVAFWPSRDGCSCVSNNNNKHNNRFDFLQKIQEENQTDFLATI